ncbi:hypothetical protein [Rhizobium ruizarguesonis]|uniref:hypothetical protein n=1 Tax=Rhizobium ruizarguesonis TaxID=2081791 RepID=UPI00102FD19E|nr:hypothetical protein [Rhizobium ruizarguesonis]TAT82481.1 hypothetical protein ELI52_02705 [Rhizobium ruizarguesonis]
MPVTSKRTPSSDPHRSLRAVTIANPYYSSTHDGEAGNPRTVPAIINLKESAITMLASRGRIDAAQLAAATRFRALWEAVCRGTRAIDYGREPVDGGGHADPISHRQMHAAEELRRVRPLLGEEGFSLVSRICVEGYSLGEVVGPGSSKRAKLKAARDLREYLDLLCEFWNLSTRR